MSAQPTRIAPSAPHLAPQSQRPWRWAQTWRDLFFAHWRVPIGGLQPHLHGDLEIDTWDGCAWVSIVAFRLDIRQRGLPAFGLWTSFVELNFRTYVRCRGESGIYFISIHASKRASVALARWLTPLPYVYAPIRYERDGTSWRFDCRQRRAGPPLLDVTVTPTGSTRPAAADATDAWLLERYRAFVPDRHGTLFRMEAQHPDWTIQRVTAQVDTNNLGLPWELCLNREPDALHWAPDMAALLWPFQPIGAIAQK
jgi:uncharacterized protein